MSRPTRFERRKPLVCTTTPSDSSHSCSKAICVDRPDPSMPSMTIRLPVISLGSNPTSGSPKKYCDDASSVTTTVFVAAGGGDTAAGPSTAGTASATFFFSWSGMVTPVPHLAVGNPLDRFCHPQLPPSLFPTFSHPPTHPAPPTLPTPPPFPTPP